MNGVRFRKIRLVRPHRALGALAVPVLLLAACNHEPSVTEFEYPYVLSGTIYMITQSKESMDNNDGLLEGQLVLDEGCLRVSAGSLSGNGYAVIWPKDFSLEVAGEAVYVLDADGQRVAGLGDRVAVGGGEGRDSNDRNGECPGPFWYSTTNDYVGAPTIPASGG